MISSYAPARHDHRHGPDTELFHRHRRTPPHKPSALRAIQPQRPCLRSYHSKLSRRDRPGCGVLTPARGSQHNSPETFSEHTGQGHKACFHCGANSPPCLSRTLSSAQRETLSPPNTKPPSHPLSPSNLRAFSGSRDGVPHGTPCSGGARCSCPAHALPRSRSLAQVNKIFQKTPLD